MGLIVVEARRRSGSLITARHALDQGREVGVVPGPVGVAPSAGSNALLRDGAWPILEPADALALVNWAEDPPAARQAREMPADPDVKCILERLLEQPFSRDELIRGLGLPAEKIAVGLALLCLDGWIAEERDGRFRATPDRLPSA